MTSPQNEILVNNPFLKIRVRHIFLWLFLFFIIIVMQTLLIFYLFKRQRLEFKTLDPIWDMVLGLFVILLTAAWIIRQCNLAGIKIDFLIGRVPRNYSWSSLVYVIIARFFANLGSYWVVYSGLYSLNSAFIQNVLFSDFQNSLYGEISRTFSIPLYLLILLIYDFVNNVFGNFITQGLMLHRWSSLWGITRGITVIILFYSVLILLGRSFNIFSIIVYLLSQICLYSQSSTLIIPVIAEFVLDLLFYGFNFMILAYYQYNGDHILQQYQNGTFLKLGLVFVSLSFPYLIYFFWKYLPRNVQSLPYFVREQKQVNSSSD